MDASVAFEYGLVGLAMIVVYKVLEVGKQLFLNKRGIYENAYPCQADPTYGERLRRMDKRIEDIGERVTTGATSCQWKDRDEVRDMIEILRKLVDVTTTNVQETRALTEELRKTRNGRQ
jgi:Zn-finger protein